MSPVMSWDELNILKDGAREVAIAPVTEPERRKAFCDWMEYVLCLIYAYGWEDAQEVVGPLPEPGELQDEAIRLEIAGETFRERAERHLMEGDVEALVRLIDTEATRDYSAGVMDAGTASGLPGLMKQWQTMLDGRVRDTHDYLQGAEVGLEDRFYTFDGDSALGPGGFADPNNNVNCRCWLTLSRA